MERRGIKAIQSDAANLALGIHQKSDFAAWDTTSGSRHKRRVVAGRANCTVRPQEVRNSIAFLLGSRRSDAN
jgi:hypothetical protein